MDGNGAYEGGGAYLNGGTSNISQADISTNTASESGGGLWVSTQNADDPSTITQSTISDNSVPARSVRPGSWATGAGSSPTAATRSP